MQIRRLVRARRTATVPPPAPAAPLTACGAANATMYFSPDGNVRACCVNTDYTLGHVSESSIREIWEGARIQALRHALDRHDFSLGCQDCEHRIAAGDRSWSTAEQYDGYRADEPGEFPRRMDFILSISCNLQCAMCNGDLSSSIRIHREKRPPMASPYGDAFFEELEEFLPHLERSVFLGGEPFVAREPQRVWDQMIALGLDAPVQVVTNGTQWGPKVERYLRELPMSLAVSIDGFNAETLEPLRVGVDRDRLFENVDRYQEAVAAGGGTVSFHYCLMRQNWHEFGRFCLEADRRGVHVLVMTVTGPAGFSLWDLPAAELREVLDALEREDEEIGPRLDRNQGAWRAELDRIRRHLDTIGTGTTASWVAVSLRGPTGEPVALRSEPPTTVPLAAGRTDHEAELAAWAGRPPVRLTARSGVIESVESSSWAEPLHPDEWVGRPLDSLAEILGGMLGTPVATEVVHLPDSVASAEVAFIREGATPVEVRSLAFVGPERDTVRVALATDAPEDRLQQAWA